MVISFKYIPNNYSKYIPFLRYFCIKMSYSYPKIVSDCTIIFLMLHNLIFFHHWKIQPLQLVLSLFLLTTQPSQHSPDNVTLSEYNCTSNSNTIRNARREIIPYREIFHLQSGNIIDLNNGHERNDVGRMFSHFNAEKSKSKESNFRGKKYLQSRWI